MEGLGLIIWTYHYDFRFTTYPSPCPHVDTSPLLTSHSQHITRAPLAHTVHAVRGAPVSSKLFSHSAAAASMFCPAPLRAAPLLRLNFRFLSLTSNLAQAQLTCTNPTRSCRSTDRATRAQWATWRETRPWTRPPRDSASHHPHTPASVRTVKVPVASFSHRGARERGTYNEAEHLACPELRALRVRLLGLHGLRWQQVAAPQHAPPLRSAASPLHRAAVQQAVEGSTGGRSADSRCEKLDRSTTRGRVVKG